MLCLIPLCSSSPVPSRAAAVTTLDLHWSATLSPPIRQLAPREALCTTCHASDSAALDPSTRSPILPPGLFG